jgi:hypothetical protein
MNFSWNCWWKRASEMKINCQTCAYAVQLLWLKRSLFLTTFFLRRESNFMEINYVNISPSECEFVFALRSLRINVCTVAKIACNKKKTLDDDEEEWMWYILKIFLSISFLKVICDAWMFFYSLLFIWEIFNWNYLSSDAMNVSWGIFRVYWEILRSFLQLLCLRI